jgi:hypothetical protein
VIDLLTTLVRSWLKVGKDGGKSHSELSWRIPASWNKATVTVETVATKHRGRENPNSPAYAHDRDA